MDLNQAIRQRTESITDDLIRIRRAIHENPELGFEEFETAALVSKSLADLGIPHQTGVAKTGVVGLLEGGSDGKTLAIRADMDALPIEEPEDLDFASKVPGKMHACGHDAHTTILLGVAMVLSELKESIQGRVKFIFQPCEEGLGGAELMIEEGVLENPAIDLCLGFHNWPPVDAGKIGYHPDVAFSSANAFDITLTGVASHAAHPQSAVDVITNAAYFITQLQTIVSREILPTTPVVISIGQIHAGTARNILPDALTLEGTVRTQSQAAVDQVEAAMRRILDGMQTGMRIGYDLDFQRGVPVLRNTKDVLAQVLGSVESILGKDKIVELPAGSMGTEDFAFFTERVPGAHLRIGSKVEGLDTMLHKTNYQFNESAIPTAVQAVSRAAIDLLS